MSPTKENRDFIAREIVKNNLRGLHNMNTNHPITQNIKKVLETEDLELLNRKTYLFLSNEIGFAAHHNIWGFKDHYKDEGIFIFVKDLMTGPMSFETSGLKSIAAVMTLHKKESEASITLAIWEEAKKYFEAQNVVINDF